MITFMCKFNFGKRITYQNVKVLKILSKFKWMWWNWILISKITWFLGPIDRVRGIKIGERLTRKTFSLINSLIIESNPLIGRVIEFWVWIMSFILLAIGSSWKDEYESWFWKLWWSRESIKFCDYCSDSRNSSLFIFRMDDCSFWIGVTEKDEYDSWKFSWDDGPIYFEIVLLFQKRLPNSLLA